MMLDRYILRHTIWPFCVVTLLLSAMIWMAQAFRILDLVVNRGIAMSDFAMVAVLLLPFLAFLLLPIASLIAVLYVLYRMYSDKELIVCKALGMSSWRITLPMLRMMIVVTIISYLNAVVVMPYSYKKFKDMQDYFRNNYAALLLQEGSFNSQIPGLTVYVSQQSGNEVHGIFVYDHRSDKKQTVITAASGRIVKTAGSALLELEDGTHQEKSLTTGGLSILKFSRYTFGLQLVAPNGSTRAIDPNELDLWALWRHLHSGSDPISLPKSWANFHQRLTWPLYAITLALLVAAFIVASPEYSRRLPLRQYMMAAGASALILISAIVWANLGVRHGYIVVMLYFNHILALTWSIRRLKAL